MGTVQKILAAFLSIVQDNRKATRCRYDELLGFFVGVPASGGTCRHIIKIVSSLNRKRNVAITLDEGQIPTMIGYFRQVNDTSGSLFHIAHSETSANRRSGSLQNSSCHILLHSL